MAEIDFHRISETTEYRKFIHNGESGYNEKFGLFIYAPVF